MISSSIQDRQFPPNPSFQEYRALKNELLDSLSQQKKNTMMRLDCMKPATALSHYLKPIPLCRPPFDESYDVISSELKSLWKDITGIAQDGTVITKGVRDGIFISLQALSRGGRSNELLIPADVYPVYARLVEQSRMSSICKTFDTLQGIDIEAILASSTSSSSKNSNKILLLPHPITPLGRRFTSDEIDQLRKWLLDDHTQSRYLFLDCVYSFDMQKDSKLLEPLTKLDNVVTLHSLAKGWISPFLEPLTTSCEDPLRVSVGPESRSNRSNGIGFLHSPSKPFRDNVECELEEGRLKPTHSACKQSYLTLQQQPELPKILGNRLHQQWNRMSARLKDICPSFETPPTGYFATVDKAYSELFQKHDMIAVPASVFGGHSGSVVSCLYDIKDDDFAVLGEAAQAKSDGNVALPMYHVTTLSNFIKGYDKYSRRYSKANITQSTFKDKFFLLHAHQLSTGFEKASKLLKKLDIDGDCFLVLHTEIEQPSGDESDGQSSSNKLYAHPKGQYLRRDWIKITALSLLPSTPKATLEGISVEEAAARSLRLQGQTRQPYQSIRPRSISIMPIAKGCQAKCPFCFSKGSVSNDMKQQRTYEANVIKVLQAAHRMGAERAVITGGGEPFMLPFSRLLELIRQCSNLFSTVCAITNGYSLSQLVESERLEALQELDRAGLSVLSVSRHAVEEEDNEKIMYLRTESLKVAKSWHAALSEGLLHSLTRFRWVCVMQKGGVDDVDKIHEYVRFAVQSGANEVCFKELYVSTSVESLYHHHESNLWSNEHQVPLSLVLEFCQRNGFKKTAELPWGAPIFEGEFAGGPVKIAAYTEPSVYWERSQGVCRSWNYMTNGDVLASLEDKNSQVDISLLAK